MRNNSNSRLGGEDLPGDIAQKVDELCLRGNKLAEAEQEDEAVRMFQEAYGLLPAPVERWYAATWIQIAIGDVAYLRGDLDAAAEAFNKMGQFEGWHDNPFVRLRRGQVALDFGDTQKATNELAAAFMLGGYEIFDAEDDKYAEFVLSKLLPPEPPVDHPLARFHLEPDKIDIPVERKPWWRFW